MATLVNQIERDSAFTIQCRVLYALILRDIKGRFGGRRLGFMWALLEPCLFITLFVVMFQLIGRTSQAGIEVPLFFVTGITPFLMFRDLFGSISNEAKANSPLLMFPQVSKTDLIFASLIVNVLVSIAVFILLLTACFAMGYTFTIDDPLGVLNTLFLLVALGLGLGLVIGALTIRYEFVSSLSQALLGRPLFFTSGLFFTADILPPKAREYALYNPVLHGIESIRSAMFVSFESRYVDLNYVFFFAVTLIALGLMMLSFFDRQSR